MFVYAIVIHFALTEKITQSLTLAICYQKIVSNDCLHAYSD